MNFKSYYLLESKKKFHIDGVYKGRDIEAALPPKQYSDYLNFSKYETAATVYHLKQNGNFGYKEVYVFQNKRQVIRPRRVLTWVVARMNSSATTKATNWMDERHNFFEKLRERRPYIAELLPPNQPKGGEDKLDFSVMGGLSGYESEDELYTLVYDGKYLSVDVEVEQAWDDIAYNL